MTKRLVLRIEEDGTPAAYIELLKNGGADVPLDPTEPPPVVIPPAGAGWVVVTSELAWTFKDNRTVLPTNCWSTDGSYWLFDITYRTA